MIEEEHPIEGLMDDIMTALRLGSVFSLSDRMTLRKRIRKTVAKAFYMRETPEGLSDKDLMSVMLRVEDWQHIRDNLYMDADGEAAGACEELAHQVEVDGPGWEAAIDAARTKDGQATACHQTAAATERCADVIDETLRINGWPS
jgi:hypothetical protein